MAQSAVIGFQPEHRTLARGQKNRDRKVNIRICNRGVEAAFPWTGCGCRMRMVLALCALRILSLGFSGPCLLTVGHATVGTHAFPCLAERW